MKLPLTLISLDDGSVGIFTSKEKLLYAIEAPDALNYRIFDTDGIEQELLVVRKSWFGLFLGYEMKIVSKSETSIEALEDLIFYLTRQLNYLGVCVKQDKAEELPYLLDLFINNKGYDQLF